MGNTEYMSTSHGNGATAFLTVFDSSSDTDSVAPIQPTTVKEGHNSNMTVLTADSPSTLADFKADCVVKDALWSRQRLRGDRTHSCHKEKGPVS